MPKPDGMYEHTDLVLESTIALANIPGMKSVSERRDNKVVWTYKRTAELDEFLSQFYAGKRVVEPLAFSRMLRSVRNAVYQLMDYNPPRLAQASSDKPAV